MPVARHHRGVGCVRCGRRRVDPVGGPSTWRRGVVAGEQVLICPDCQVEGWTDGLDTCATCGSTMLVKQLGVVSCRACGGAMAEAGDHGVPLERAGSTTHDESLATDVAEALDRVLGQSPADG